MSKKNLKQHFYFLQSLARSRPKQKKTILKVANNGQIKSICEVCLNVLKGNLPVNIKKLKKYKNIIRKLANKSISYGNKKRMLMNQTGGFLPLIAPAILSALGGIVGRVISKKL